MLFHSINVHFINHYLSKPMERVFLLILILLFFCFELNSRRGIDTTTRLVWWMDFEWIPFHLADKSVQPMCHDIQPNPNYVYRRTFCTVLQYHVNILVCCPALNSTVDHSLWECRLLHVHRQIWHESSFPSTCLDPKSIPFGVFLCFRLDFHFHRPE